MARVKRAVQGKKHRRAILEKAEGYSGSRSRHFRKANEQVMHSGNYAFRDRRARKGDFRKLWIVRINAACRLQGMGSSQFFRGLKPGDVGGAERGGPGGEPVALGSKHSEIKRLRSLLRDSSARAAESAFVLEGPKIVEDALRRDAVFDAIFLGPNARVAFRDLLDLAAVDDVP